jgi:penicillin-binding protein 2
MAAKKYVGGVVAIAPKTGEVLCLVSSPSFDPNVFKGGISQADWDLLQNDSNNPLLNRPLGASYSPGSTFKIVTTLAAVETGKFDPNRYIYCSGGFRIGKRTFKCLGHHGSISFEKAFEKSCNTYFATLGYQVGEEAIRRAALEVGMGQKTGIDIGSESRGVVPTNEWMERWFKDPHWYGGDTVNLSIGQGYLRTTPIQMANLACLVANNGVNYRPHLVRGFIDPGNDNKQTLIQPQVAHQTKVDPGYWLALKRAMQRVVESGTGAAARIPGITWGAKTGSTEHGKGKKTHSWFIGIAPIDDPQICVCVLIEQAGHGGEIAAPIAREVVKRYLVKPTTPPKSARNDLRVPSNAASASRTEPTLSTSPDRR